jgi:FKBP-type peptidyl-prolyl cis-trans isomerase SlyD
MQIADEMAVTIHYKVANTEGEVLDTSEGDEPLAYIHGQGSIVPGLEQALLGKQAGDKVQITVAPEDGYGVHEPEKVQTVPRSAFDTETQIEPGMQFQAEGEDGEVIVTVTEVTDEEVTVDANHPLAGQTLHFEVEVVAVRPCTDEELAHGHIHGEGGHHH